MPSPQVTGLGLAGVGAAVGSCSVLPSSHCSTAPCERSHRRRRRTRSQSRHPQSSPSQMSVLPSSHCSTPARLTPSPQVSRHLVEAGIVRHVSAVVRSCRRRSPRRLAVTPSPQVAKRNTSYCRRLALLHVAVVAGLDPCADDAVAADEPRVTSARRSVGRRRRVRVAVVALPRRRFWMTVPSPQMAVTQLVDRYQAVRVAAVAVVAVLAGSVHDALSPQVRSAHPFVQPSSVVRVAVVAFLAARRVL